VRSDNEVKVTRSAQVRKPRPLQLTSVSSGRSRTRLAARSMAYVRAVVSVADRQGPCPGADAKGPIDSSA